ncbi:hypothetical protein YQE_08496, partial [Dendroctonus ponderosae]
MFGYAKNEPYYHPQPNYYSTLPSKKTQYFSYDLPPERSVTPDITRGLDRAYRNEQQLLSMAEIGIPVSELKEDMYGSARSRSPSYRYDHSSRSLSQEDSLKISPIDPRHSGGFKSSTPSQMRAAENLETRLLSPKRSTMSNEELYAVIHKTKKKLNIEDDLNRTSPPLCGPREPDSSTPKKVSVETGYIGSRQSWSPSKGEYIDFNADIDKFSPINQSRTRQSWACNDRKGSKKTSTLDFKKLLLQKSSSLSGNKKISAVEQLKLSKQQMLKAPAAKSNDMTILDLSASPRSLVNRKTFNNPPGSPERGTVKPVPKILSPRSQWRFTNPRSDVLSSTIMEDCREDDTSSNASKSSLEKRVRDLTVQSSPAPGKKLTSLPESSKSEQLRTVEQNQSTKYMSVSERMSAQRVKFFDNANQNNESSKVNKLPPTLETAF